MWFVIGCLVFRYGGGVEHGEKWWCQSTVIEYDAQVLVRATALYARVFKRAGVVPELLSRLA